MELVERLKREKEGGVSPVFLKMETLAEVSKEDYFDGDGMNTEY